MKCLYYEKLNLTLNKKCFFNALANMQCLFQLNKKFIIVQNAKNKLALNVYSLMKKKSLANNIRNGN